MLVKGAAAVPLPSSLFMSFKPLLLKGNVGYDEERRGTVVTLPCFTC